MVLKMPRPVKHPKTGIYQFRKRVPDDLRSMVGKREEKASLGTRDPGEARTLHARKLAEVEERWRMLRSGILTLTEKQAVAISGEIYRKLVADYDEKSWKRSDSMPTLISNRRHACSSAPGVIGKTID